MHRSGDGEDLRAVCVAQPGDVRGEIDAVGLVEAGVGRVRKAGGQVAAVHEAKAPGPGDVRGEVRQILGHGVAQGLVGKKEMIGFEGVAGQKRAQKSHVGHPAAEYWPVLHEGVQGAEDAGLFHVRTKPHLPSFVKAGRHNLRWRMALLAAGLFLQDWLCTQPVTWRLSIMHRTEHPEICGVLDLIQTLRPS